MSAPDLLIAALLITVWASNFVVAAIGLTRVPPFTLATLRFLFAAFPAVLFVKRPKVSWARLAPLERPYDRGQ